MKYSNIIQFHEVFFGMSFFFSSDSSPKSIVCCSKILVLIMYRTDNHNKKRKTFHHEDINANYKNYFVTVIQPYGKIFLQVRRRHRASMESVLLFRSFEKDFTKKRIFQNNWFHEKRFFRIIGFTKKMNLSNNNIVALIFISLWLLLATSTESLEISKTAKISNRNRKINRQVL